MKKIVLVLIFASTTVWAQGGNAPNSIVATQCQDFDKVCMEMKVKFSKHYVEPGKSKSSTKKSKEDTDESYTSN